jgi:hypothetical protein
VGGEPSSSRPPGLGRSTNRRAPFSVAPNGITVQGADDTVEIENSDEIVTRNKKTHEKDLLRAPEAVEAISENPGKRSIQKKRRF